MCRRGSLVEPKLVVVDPSSSLKELCKYTYVSYNFLQLLCKAQSCLVSVFRTVSSYRFLKSTSRVLAAESEVGWTALRSILRSTSTAPAGLHDSNTYVHVLRKVNPMVELPSRRSIWDMGLTHFVETSHGAHNKRNFMQRTLACQVLEKIQFKRTIVTAGGTASRSYRNCGHKSHARREDSRKARLINDLIVCAAYNMSESNPITQVSTTSSGFGITMSLVMPVD